jgi:acetyltransferase
MADLGASLGLQWAQLGETTEQSLRRLLPSFGALSNPIDLTSAQTGAPTLYTEAMRVVAHDPAVDIVVPILVVSTAASAHAIVDLHNHIEKPMAVLWTGFCSDDASVTPATLNSRGVPTYRDALTCVQAISASIAYAHFLSTRRQHAGADRSRPPGIDVKKARERLHQGPMVMTERLSKAVLAQYGLEVTREHLARNAEEAVACAEALGGSVAVKIESVDIPHKTDAGAVRLGVHGAEHIRNAFHEVTQAARRYKPDADIEGVLVQEMVPAGVQMMLGITIDATFGPVITVAAGGIHVEAVRDVTHRVIPLARESIEDMLGELRMRPLLDGLRSAPRSDLSALIDTIERLAWLAADLGDDIAELDINPLVVLEAGAGVRVIDALIVKAARSHKKSFER